jgi:glycosyltransferase involved in cell wall biosynthesis
LNLLFVHQNFPGQYKHLAPAMARLPGHRVVAMHINATPAMPGVATRRYSPTRGSTPGVHRWVSDLETKVIRGEAAYQCARQLRDEGFTPDVIVAHPGWGESLFLKDVWPQARLGIYCEFFYQPSGADVGFDPEFPTAGEDDACRLRLKNANYQLHFPMAHAGLSPTHWQQSVFPEPFRERIRVIHDGIDTAAVCPNPGVSLQLKTSSGTALTLTRDDELITFVNRNLEPYRGYHIFMRALPAILRARPKARVLIVGGDGVSYGAPPTGPLDDKGVAPKGWKQIFLNEVKDQVDLQRVHFLGNIPYAQFVSLLQISTVHTYLTYPFVLSWSLLEAMSAGCAIVASNTAPVQEAIVHGETGVLVDFLDVAQLAEQVIGLCEDAPQRKRLGEAARAFAVSQYDLRNKCLPEQMQWVTSLRDA